MNLNHEDIMRSFFLILLLALFTGPAVAQQHMNDPDNKVQGSGTLPDGWHARFDHSHAGPGDIKFTADDSGYHITAGPAAIYYHEDRTAKGDFNYSGTFVQHAETSHPEAYGLFVGGKDLQQKNQHYLYFLIRQDGQYLIKRRNGSGTETITGWTSSDAVNAVGSSGEITNKLGILTDSQGVHFYINGQEVKTLANDQATYTDGIAGLRINHRLDITVHNLMLGNAAY